MPSFSKIAASIAFALAASSAQGAPYDVMEFTGPAPGKDAAFQAWYTNHIAQVLKAPDVRSVQRFKVEQAQRPGTPYPPLYLQIALDTENLDAAAAALSALMQQGSAVIDKDVTITAYYAPRPKVMARDVPGTAPAPAIAGKTTLKRFYLLAMVNADSAHEAAFNSNYDEKHFPDVIRNPGVTWGQRSQLVRAEPAGIPWPGYLAVYEYSAYDIGAANDEVNRRLAEHITRPLIFTAKGGHTWYAGAMGPALHAH